MTTQDASKPADARSATERPGRWTDDLVDNQIGRAGREGHPWPERSTRDGRLVAVGRSFQSEARKLRRGGTFLAMGGLAALAVLSSVLSFALAKNGLVEAGRGPELSVPTLQELTTPGGLVLGFRIGSTFTGLLLMVLCAATTATEYAQGTIRAIFMREPRRVAWLAGRMGALLGLLVVALVGAFVLSAGTSVLMAELRNVPTDQWWTADALRQAGKDYLNVLVATTFFAITGTTLGLLVRSTTAAVLLGVAWMFPLEHIVQQAWLNAAKWLPGLVFNDIGTGGNVVSGYRGPLLLGLAYAAVLALVGVVSLARRDVTS